MFQLSIHKACDTWENFDTQLVYKPRRIFHRNTDETYCRVLWCDFLREISTTERTLNRCAHLKMLIHDFTSHEVAMEEVDNARSRITADAIETQLARMTLLTR